MNPSKGFYDKCNGNVMLGKEQKRMNDSKWNVWLLRSSTFSKIWITMAKFETNKLLNVDIGMSQIIHWMKKIYLEQTLGKKSCLKLKSNSDIMNQLINYMVISQQSKTCFANQYHMIYG